ncbi:hypothetical protein D9756_003638 [Leucocoprinus leucothites]|uniref:Type 1 phosphatases regulator n=1 Tax=Leucocoprinus leucothites TaxID=201217 RepID=A0A8H5LJV7_9AGAR|nr:hypothetical protein D9756_003638 [Leucoagaricus leucothites]
MSYSLASTSTALRSTSSPANGSLTVTVTDDHTNEGTGDNTQVPDSTGEQSRVLHLRGARNTGPRVAWDDDVVDNEHLGKKKSKICCIYHKPRRFDESSSEESSSDESDSDSSCGGEGHDHHDHHHHHHGRHRHRHNHKHKPRDREVDGECGGEPEPNAYERQPQRKGKGIP